MSKKKEPQESEFRFGIIEQEPKVKKAYVTVMQTTRIWDGNMWAQLGHRFFEMPTKAMKEEVEEWLKNGKQITVNERIQKLKSMTDKQKRKKE